VCDELLRVMEGHVFVAHNAEFDWRFLSAEVQRATGRQLMGRRLCTVRLARRVLPQLRSRRLDSLADYYNVEITARHRAAGDAVATAHILLRLLDEAREHDCRSWDALQQFLATRQSTRRPRRAPAMPRSIDKDTTA
jgi:DNA polymerase-3 subunit epsilon